MDKFKKLTQSKIEKINIKDNPVVSENENYKKILFEIIPSLKSIDGEDKEGNPIESTDYGDSEEEEGDYEGEEFEGESGDEIGEEDEGDVEDDEVDEVIEDEEDNDDDEEEDKPPKKKSQH